MTNVTSPYDLPPLPAYTLQRKPDILPWLGDQHLAYLLPIVAYWGVSMLFHFIDEWDLFPQYRLHTPAEVLKRNHVSRWEVFRDVIIQQIIQSAVGWLLAYFEPEAFIGKEEYDIAVWAQRTRIAQRAIPAVLGFFGVNAGALAQNVAKSHPLVSGALAGGNYPSIQQTMLADGVTVPAFAPWELLVAKTIYWALIPALQFGIAILTVDTWQYFWHRAMHMNKWLYTTFHSRHHRLYVPYAYGALYNHPFEGFLLDTLGAGLGYLLSGMSARQGVWFFTCSTIKTVDDHCGYALPWDPLQHLTSNNAGYHDIHHQSWGIKTNFSQPFFTFWDGFMGTKWAGGDVSARYERAKLAAQKKVDGVASISGSTSAESALADNAPYSTETRDATVTTKKAQSSTLPKIPPGKATKQALDSRGQVLQDKQGGGASVLIEEAQEEREAQISLRRSPRKTMTKTSSQGLKGLKDRVNNSFHGRGGGVLGVED